MVMRQQEKPAPLNTFVNRRRRENQGQRLTHQVCIMKAKARQKEEFAL